MIRPPSVLKNWQRVRRYAVPHRMIEECTTARLNGDWRAACAAGGIDVTFDDPADARDDLLGLIPDLLRWHLPRTLGGRTSLATRDSWVLLTGPFADREHVLVLRPPKTVDGSQRLRLDLVAASDISRSDTVDLPPHLWHARFADGLREAWGGASGRLPRFTTAGDPLPEEQFAASGEAGQAAAEELPPGGGAEESAHRLRGDGGPADVEELAHRLRGEGRLAEAWAAAGIVLGPSIVGETPEDFAQRSEDPWNANAPKLDAAVALKQSQLRTAEIHDWLAQQPLQLTSLRAEATRLRQRYQEDRFLLRLGWKLGVILTWSEDHWSATLDSYPYRHDDVRRIPSDLAFLPPDLDLLWHGLITADDLHPLVRKALQLPAVADIPAATVEEPIRVRCQGQWHVVSESAGSLDLPGHTEAEIRREAALRGLGGEVTGCFHAAQVWRGAKGRLPRALRLRRQDLLQRLLHADAAGVHALLDAGLDPQLRDGRGQSLLHHLRRWDHTTLLPRLLEAGLPIDTRDHRDRTPLSVAIGDGGELALVEALLNAGADLGMAGHDGTSALELAQYKAGIWDDDDGDEQDEDDDPEFANIKAIYRLLKGWAKR
ncbi:ankyrin repeat domain-containing protein [Catelliglobosispora koreensis]|uniref:ankyrin repeat domain-containing protein n=1 Tax=Catelliglobosispora koreensis TaxID=129052 RepID=UPI0004775ABF|nr:ankyrin repeat domain-containing protein [Catelliglobosispora koreensis]